jgi:prophage regulatory protein
MAILKYPAVTAETGLSVSTIRRLIAQAAFPQPLKLSQRSVGFQSDDIQQWLKERAGKVAQ